jgi:hypothetical protein
MIKEKSIFAFLLLYVLTATQTQAAEWRQRKEWSDNYGANLEITATYYATEYIEKETQEQAKKNLWTSDEMEDYRYNLLQQLKLDDTIPIFLKFVVRGPALHMSPFERHIYLWVGKHRLTPVDYDRRFNFKVTDEREGFVYFPRFDDKGKPYMTPKVKSIKLEIDGSITPVTMSRQVDFFWDVKDDNPDKLLRGKSGAKLELDRLTKRMSNLTKEGKELNDKLVKIEEEMRMINTRMMELQKQIK